MATCVEEREMPRSQRALVDTCFEEGQYEAGISTLDQLRSFKYKPSITHIRQLLYLALYPPPRETEKDDNVGPPGSPSKVVAAKNSVPTQLPDAHATEAAQRVLLAFARTNSAGSLLRALPDASIGPRDNTSSSEDESFIAEQGRKYIGNSKGCWVLIKEGFVKRLKMSSRKTRRKKDSKWQDDLEDEEADAEEPLSIAPNAWPVLEWLILLFEGDEVATEKEMQPRYSPILLLHLPEPRGTTLGKWDVNPALELILLCLEQPQTSRSRLGIRLFNLLVNLTSTTLIDLPMFTKIIVNRIPNNNITSTLLSNLPLTSTSLRFKLTLTQALLTEGDSGSSGTSRFKPKPKPQGRPQPRARPMPRAPGAAPDTPVPAPAPAVAMPIAANRAVLEWTNLVGVLEQPGRSTLKYELLTAYILLQRQRQRQQQKEKEGEDAEWQAMITHDGQFDAFLGRVFGSGAQSLIYSSSLSALVN